MPYITPATRTALDPHIKRLQQALAEVGDDPGCLNYVISRLVAKVYRRHPRYATIATISGVLRNVDAEFYRRLGARHEDRVLDFNGDIVEYED